MAIVKIKNPTEYSFTQWMNAYPQSWHFLDMKRFYIFVRTVHRYRSKKWKNLKFLEEKILEHTPNFKQTNLETILNLYYHMLDMLDCHWIIAPESDKIIPKDTFIELEVINNKIVESIKPLRKVY